MPYIKKEALEFIADRLEVEAGNLQMKLRRTKLEISRLARGQAELKGKIAECFRLRSALRNQTKKEKIE